jgi:hypothetical protein
MRLSVSDLTNRIVSASATLIAITALATGIYQAKLSRDQAKASVWPYLISGNSGNNGYSRIVENVGLGPAIISGFEVRVDGRPLHSWHEVAESLHIPLSFKGSHSTTFRHGWVVPTNATIDLLELPDTADVRLIRSKLDHVETWVCYCSLYGDCWETKDSIIEPSRVNACFDDPKRAFRQ